MRTLKALSEKKGPESIVPQKPPNELGDLEPTNDFIIASLDGLTLYKDWSLPQPDPIENEEISTMPANRVSEK